MDEFFANGRVVDWILALMAAEFIALSALSRLGTTSLRFRAVFFSLAAGAGLVMALREALVRADWTAIAAWLLIALVAHVVDVAMRLNEKRLSR